MSGMTFELDSPDGRMMATILAGIVQFERDLISKHVIFRLAAARARGRKPGRQTGQRPKSDKLTPQVLAAVAEGRSYRWIAHNLSISNYTVLSIVKRHRENPWNVISPRIANDPFKDEVNGRFSLKIVSWNLLHSVGARIDDIAAIIEQEAPDLFLMQEVTGAIGGLADRVGGRFYPQTWPGKRHGLAAWSPETAWETHPLKLPASKMPGRFPTRFAQILQTGDVTIANVHLSHGQILNRRQLYRIARSTDGPTAIVGDFNALGPVLLPGFFDVGPRDITHHAQQVLPLRLDRCMARDLKIVHSRTLDRGPSDHRPILLRFHSGPME